MVQFLLLPCSSPTWKECSEVQTALWEPSVAEEGNKIDEPKQRKEPVLPWMRHPVEVDSFQELPLELVPCLDPRLESALKCIGVKALFTVLVAVWQETVGPGAAERDLCVCSPTGSGKTLAYALPIVQMLSTRTLQYRRARGFWFVVFAEPAIADRVVLDKHTIDGRTVEAKKAIPRDDQQHATFSFSRSWR